MFSIFGNKPEAAAAPAPAAAPTGEVQPGNLPAAAPATPDGTVASPVVAPVEGAAAPGTEGTADSPLDQFKDMWEPVTNEGGAASNNAAPAALDPKKLQEAVAKVDFSKVITPENLNKIAAGGEDAQVAFADSMNSVAQQVLTQSTLVANKMTEQAIANALKQQEAKLPEMLRKQNLSESLRDSNPLYSNPAVKPVMEAVQAQLATKNPNATPAELATMTKDFVKVMGEAFSPAATTSAPGSSPKGEQDWSQFI